MDNKELQDIRYAVEEVRIAVDKELRSLGSPNSEIINDCLSSIEVALRALQFGDSIKNARELIASASERAARLRQRASYLNIRIKDSDDG